MDFTRAYDNDWSNTVMIFASKNPAWTHQQAVDAAIAEYRGDGLATPFDDRWLGTKGYQSGSANGATE